MKELKCRAGQHCKKCGDPLRQKGTQSGSQGQETEQQPSAELEEDQPRKIIGLGKTGKNSNSSSPVSPASPDEQG